MSGSSLTADCAELQGRERVPDVALGVLGPLLNGQLAHVESLCMRGHAMQMRNSRHERKIAEHYHYGARAQVGVPRDAAILLLLSLLEV